MPRRRYRVSATRKSTPGRREVYQGQHRFEHWYRGNTVYFITARRRDRLFLPEVPYRRYQHRNH